jgi:hypothetical protein
MQRQVPANLLIVLAVIICGPAVWADENPKAAKTGNEVQRQVREPPLADQTSEVAETSPSNVKKAESAVVVPEATGHEVTVSWKGGQLFFPEAGGKASGLRLRCAGIVMIKGKGVTAKTSDLDVTIEEKGVIATASNLSLGCTGSVMIEWKGFTAMASDLQYDAEKDLLTLSSGGKPMGCILRPENKDGTNALVIADQISLSPSGSRVNCVGVREYRAVDRSTTGQLQAAFLPPAPSYPANPGTYTTPGVYSAPPATTYAAPGTYTAPPGTYNSPPGGMPTPPSTYPSPAVSPSPSLPSR